MVGENLVDDVMQFLRQHDPTFTDSHFRRVEPFSGRLLFLTFQNPRKNVIALEFLIQAGQALIHFLEGGNH